MTSNRTIFSFLLRINLTSFVFYSSIYFWNQDSLNPGYFHVLCKVELSSSWGRELYLFSYLCKKKPKPNYFWKDFFFLKKLHELINSSKRCPGASPVSSSGKGHFKTKSPSFYLNRKHAGYFNPFVRSPLQCRITKVSEVKPVEK